MLLSCVHEGLVIPGKSSIIIGKYDYYHYNCDGFNDVGWGCGYRTSQTILSWINYKRSLNIKIPNLLEIQNILVKCGDKSEKFIGSKEWIGSFECNLLIDHLFDIPSKIIHVKPYDIQIVIDQLWSHFDTIGSPLMMGGDKDASSKCILGISSIENDVYLLVLDPHCSKQNPTINELQSEGWIKWINVNEFNNESFYNFCLPQVKG